MNDQYEKRFIEIELSTLRELRSLAVTGAVPNPECGICLNADEVLRLFGFGDKYDRLRMMRQHANFFADYIPKWSGYSGSAAYPIKPSANDQGAFIICKKEWNDCGMAPNYRDANVFAYYTSRYRDEMWSGYYLVQRLSLIDHLINCAESLR